MPTQSLQKIELSYLTPGMFVSALEAQEESMLKVQGRVSSYKDIAELERREVQYVWVDKSLSARECVFPPPRKDRKRNKSVKIDLQERKQSLDEDNKQSAGINHSAALVLEARNIVSRLIDKDTANLEKMAVELDVWSDSIVEAVSTDESVLRVTMSMREADTYLLEHSISMAFLLVRFGHFLKLSETTLSKLALGGLLHDLGKMDLDQAILNKPTKLTDEEFAHIKTHPKLGLKRAMRLPNVSRMSKEICLMHHEKLDGTGYPLGVSGDKIPLHVRMSSIVDIYDALTSERCYKKGMNSLDAFRILTKMAEEEALDRKLVYKFINCVGVYPLGSLVQISDGRIGIVWSSTHIVTKPVVKCFYSSITHQAIPVSWVNLAVRNEQITKSVSCSDLTISVEPYYKD